MGLSPLQAVAQKQEGKKRKRHLISRRLCRRRASPSATRLLLRACPTATELPSMLWAVAINLPREGGMLHAGRSRWEDFKAAGGGVLPGVFGGSSAGNGEP